MENDKVMILGTANSLSRVIWNKKEYDYWACSPVLSYDYSKGNRIDAVFEMHERSHWNTATVKELINNFILENPGTKVYMQQAHNEIKNSVEYPLAGIQKMVNHDLLGKYFTSSIGMMVAMAVYCGKYKRIELWGCHMATQDEEYGLQRSGVEAWLNYGLGKGIDYWVTPDSEVMKSDYIYGYDQRKDVILRLMNFKHAVSAGMIKYEKDAQKARDDLMQQTGAETVLIKLIEEFKK